MFASLMSISTFSEPLLLSCVLVVEVRQGQLGVAVPSPARH